MILYKLQRRNKPLFYINWKLQICFDTHSVIVFVDTNYINTETSTETFTRNYSSNSNNKDKWKITKSTNNTEIFHCT